MIRPSNSSSSASESETDSLVSDLEGLSVSAPPTKHTKPSQKRGNKRAAANSAAIPERPSSVATLKKSPSPAPKKRKRVRKPKSPTGLGSRPIVDDISEGVSEPLDEVASSSSGYEDAVLYINSYASSYFL